MHGFNHQITLVHHRELLHQHHDRVHHRMQQAVQHRHRALRHVAEGQAEQPVAVLEALAGLAERMLGVLGL